MPSISVENIGPLGSATFRLEPLNVFVGPNNAGKSVFATLIHATLGQRPRPAQEHFRPGPLTPPGTGYTRRVSVYPASSEQVTLDFDGADEGSEFLFGLVDGDAQIDPYEVPRRLAGLLAKQVQNDLNDWSEFLIAEIERCFGSPFAEIRRPRRQGVITIESTTPSWRVELRFTAAETERRIMPPKLPELLSRFHKLASQRRYIGRRMRHRERLSPDSIDVLRRDVADTLFALCFEEFPLRSRYLPAARSGLLQGHKALAGFLISQSPLAGLRDLQMPALSGVVAEFLSDLVTVDKRMRGRYSSEAEQLEERLLKGEVQLTPTPAGSPEIHFVQQRRDFPIHRTSSMVSEVAPVVLYLRHLLGRSDLLIIEEPEAHLHPSSQVIFAQILLQVANRGASVLLTTHSEFFLQQLNNAILAARVARSEIESAGMLADTRVAPANVGAYLFTERKTGGNLVERLAVTADDGISEAGFVSVAESLYDQTMRLERLAEREEGKTDQGR